MPITNGLLEATFVLWGLCIGSFLNVCIHRVPLRLSVASPRSRCPDCGYQLSWTDNVPVLSYVVLRGRCRSCARPILLRYPIIEIVTGVVFLLHWQVFGPTPLLLVRTAFACALIVHFMIDLEHQILPDVINLPGIAIGFVCSWFLPPGPLMSGLGILAGGGVLWAIAEIWLRLRKVDAMGFGDVKMLAMIGAFLGLKMVILTFVLSSLVGGVIGVILVASRRGDMATRVPYGTMLAAAALVASLYGERLLAWYLATI